MTRPDSILLQLIGVAVVILISNYHINRLTQWVPRWHATIITMLGAGLGMFGMIFIVTIILAYLQAGSVSP